jgi:hypothetical protein
MSDELRNLTDTIKKMIGFENDVYIDDDNDHRFLRAVIDKLERDQKRIDRLETILHVIKSYSKSAFKPSTQ